MSICVEVGHFGKCVYPTSGQEIDGKIDIIHYHMGLFNLKAISLA